MGKRRSEALRSAMFALRRDILGSLYRWFGATFSGRRNMASILGYDEELNYDKYLARYARDCIAGRIVEIPAEATWESLPMLVEDPAAPEKSAISEKFERLAKRVRLRQMLERADILAGIGRYSVLLIGFQDGRPLEEPVSEGSIGSDGVLYVVPFSERHAVPSKIETDTSSPHFGQPSHYQIDFMRGAAELTDPALGAWLRQFRGFYEGRPVQEVHASRIVHLAEGALEDGIYGRPRLRRVWDRLDDLAKAVGGSAEVFWLVANRGLQFDVDKDLSLTPEAIQELEGQLEEYEHGLRRAFQTRGVTIKGLNELGAGNVNPRAVFQCIAALIVGTTGIPYRMLFGTERGQNINEQDRKVWLEQVRWRRETYGSEVVLWPFLQRVVHAGALPKSALEAHLVWPPVHDDMHQAKVASTFADAELKHAKAMELGLATIGRGEWRANFLGLPRDLPEGDSYGQATRLPARQANGRMNGAAAPH